MDQNIKARKALVRYVEISVLLRFFCCLKLIRTNQGKIVYPEFLPVVVCISNLLFL